jgi:hypothetical protein
LPELDAAASVILFLSALVFMASINDDKQYFNLAIDYPMIKPH